MTDTPPEQVSNKILTIPNLISVVRLCLVPIFFVELLYGNNIAATVLFGVAAATDCLDGQVARRTNSVSRLGQMLDPAVDRVLMGFGVIGLLLVGRLPLWIVLVVLIRDIFLIAGAGFLLFKCKGRVAVIYAGKVATTFLFIGFCGLVLNMPLIPGLGWCDFSWLPGFNTEPVSWGIWCVYIGFCIGIFTTIIYIKRGIGVYLDWRRNTQGGIDNGASEEE
jgi:cardiolipin synthase